MRRPVWIGVGAVLLGSAGVGFVAGQANAAPAVAAPGSGFESMGLIGEAGGARIVFTQQETKQPNGAAEADMPFAQMALTKSGGRAFAAVAWPGTLAGNLGSTVTLLTGQTLPFDANDPARAETQTGSGPATQTTNVPGGTMYASSTPGKVVADALFGSQQNTSAGSLGTTHSQVVGQVTGVAGAFSDAVSSTEDIVLGGGAIKIGSVTSHAHVVTDGQTTKGSGQTTVSDMTVGGVPVTVDEQGVHVHGAGTPLNPSVAQVNQALAQTRTQIFLTQPHQTTAASGTSYDAGSLIIAFDNGGFFAEFGGAMAIAGATLSLQFPQPPPPPTVPPVGQPQPPSVPPVSGGQPPLNTGSFPPVTGGTTGGQQPNPVVQPPTGTLASANVPLSGLAPAWVVLALLGSGFIALGLRRFPDRVLDAAATSCPLDGEQP